MLPQMEECWEFHAAIPLVIDVTPRLILTIKCKYPVYMLRKVL